MRDLAQVSERCLDRIAHKASDVARLFHGRGHCYPGFEDITVDLFPPVVLVGSFAGNDSSAREVAQMLFDFLPGISGACVQFRQGRRTRFVTVAGEVPEELRVSEQGLEFVIKLNGNLNVGLFLDSAPARAWVRSRADDARVLNLFAYTCGFSVAAVAGGAKRVVNVDMSRRVLEWGKENHMANGHDLRRAYMLPGDVFKVWRKFEKLGPYDVVVIDPPTNQPGSFNAERQYAQLFKRLNKLLAPGAHVLACLNSPFLHGDFLPEQMSRWCAGCKFVEQLSGSPDFPDRFADRALKMAVFRNGG